MINDAVQTYYDYLNGASGYLVFVIGAALLIVAMVSRKQLAKVPGWLTSIVMVALILGSLPAVMNAFGINLGCGGTTTTEQEQEPPSGLVPDGDAEMALRVVGGRA